MSGRNLWTESKIIVALLVITCATLVLDLRYEHNHVVRHHAIAWVPVAYPALVTLAGIIGLSIWQRGGRQLMYWVFMLGIPVGLLGYYEHNAGNLFGDIGTLLSVWAGQHPDPSGPPPILAPLTFSGIGLIGMYVSSRVTNALPPQIKQ